MCWRDPAERYNDGVAFKAVARDANGVIVTILSDNYFGYCKKGGQIVHQLFSQSVSPLVRKSMTGGALLSRATTWRRFAAARVITNIPAR